MVSGRYIPVDAAGSHNAQVPYPVPLARRGAGTSDTLCGGNSRSAGWSPSLHRLRGGGCFGFEWGFFLCGLNCKPSTDFLRLIPKRRRVHHSPTRRTLAKKHSLPDFFENSRDHRLVSIQFVANEPFLTRNTDADDPATQGPNLMRRFFLAVVTEPKRCGKLFWIHQIPFGKFGSICIRNSVTLGFVDAATPIICNESYVDDTSDSLCLQFLWG